MPKVSDESRLSYGSVSVRPDKLAHECPGVSKIPFTKKDWNLQPKTRGNRLCFSDCLKIFSVYLASSGVEVGASRAARAEAKTKAE